MKDCLEWRVRDDCLVECVWLGDIRHNGESKFPLVGVALVCLLDLVGLLLRADSSDDRVSVVQKHIEGVGSNEAATAR